MPFNEDELESHLKAAEGWERSLLSVCFFTGMRRGEVLGLRWSGVFFDRDRILVKRSSDRHGEARPRARPASATSSAASGSRGVAEATRKSEIEERVRLPESGVEGLNVNWVTEVVWPRLVERPKFRIGRSCSPVTHTRPSCCRRGPNRLASAANGPSDPHDVDESLLALDQSGELTRRRGPIGSGQEFVKSSPPYAHPANGHRERLEHDDQMAKNQLIWRRGRDSNPRYRLPSTPD